MAAFLAPRMLIFLSPDYRLALPESSAWRSPWRSGTWWPGQVISPQARARATGRKRAWHASPVPSSGGRAAFCQPGLQGRNLLLLLPAREFQVLVGLYEAQAPSLGCVVDSSRAVVRELCAAWVLVVLAPPENSVITQTPLTEAWFGGVGVATGAMRARLRIVGIDRPGYGLSTPRPGRTIAGRAPPALVILAPPPPGHRPPVPLPARERDH
jgi:hypothetical protein